MSQFLQYILQNKEWLFSGLGITSLSILVWLFESIRSFNNAKKGNIINQIDGGDIRIVGPRASGKTVYLAALVDWHNLGNKSLINLVTPLGEDAESLVYYSQNILAHGLQLEPTNPDNADMDIVYYLGIKMIFDPLFYPVQFWLKKHITFTLSFRDYSGELFEGNIRDSHLVNYFLDDCALSSKLMIVIDALIISKEMDFNYASDLKVFLEELEHRFRRGGRNLKDYRIAIVLSKFDQLRVWKHRKNAIKFFKNQLPRSYKFLSQINADKKCSIAYFACSAFGMMGKPPQPNAKVIRGDMDFVIKDANLWKPFGLIAPIYWLCTGKIIRDS